MSSRVTLPTASTPPSAWDGAACAETDPDAFFPDQGGTASRVLRICAGCEYRVECLQYALDHDEQYGIWGGTTGRQRRTMRPRQRPGRPRVRQAES